MRRFPLFAKILCLFTLNLLLLAVAFYAVFRGQFRFGLDSLLAGQAGDRFQALGELIAVELGQLTRARWTSVLHRFGEAHNIQLSLFRADGTQLAGDPITLPSAVRARLSDRPNPSRQPPGLGPPGFRRSLATERRPPAVQPPATATEPQPQPGADSAPAAPPARGLGLGPRPGLGLGPGPGAGPGPGPGFGLGPGGRAGMRMVPDPNASVPARFPKAMLRTTRPRQYWVLVRLPVPDEEPPRRGPITLVAASTSLSFGGLLFDLGPWVAVGFSALFLSALLWFPLIRGITRSVSDMTAATDQIAQGRFEARARTQRRDELGALSQAINSMANRLGGFVYGQKRFLGDIAHELCSPLARMQMALGILEQRADDAQQPYVADVRDEVQHMSDLVNELLSFSKAGMQTRELKLQPVALAPLVRRVVEREGNQQATLDVQIDDPLEVLAEPDLLARAVANLVRNAVRYAGAAGPITISANPADERVVLVVADVGPGVPPDTLEQIFDPFYRVESSRSRETGGVGLGLAIVKTCVEACRGTVAAYNRSPTGLAVELCLVRPSGPPRPNAAERPALEDRPQEGGGRPQSSV